VSRWQARIAASRLGCQSYQSQANGTGQTIVSLEKPFPYVVGHPMNCKIKRSLLVAIDLMLAPQADDNRYAQTHKERCNRQGRFGLCRFAAGGFYGALSKLLRPL